MVNFPCRKERKGFKMIEFYVEFDLMEFGYADAYIYADTRHECTNKVKRELETWGGGHADVFEDGEFVFDVEY